MKMKCSAEVSIIQRVAKTTSRWNLVAGLILLWVVSMAGMAQAATKNFLMYVGTYTAKDSKGIYVYRFDSGKGKLTPVGLAVEAENPSFVLVHPNGKVLYA